MRTVLQCRKLYMRKADMREETLLTIKVVPVARRSSRAFRIVSAAFWIPSLAFLVPVSCPRTWAAESRASRRRSAPERTSAMCLIARPSPSKAFARRLGGAWSPSCPAAVEFGLKKSSRLAQLPIIQGFKRSLQPFPNIHLECCP